MPHDLTPYFALTGSLTPLEAAHETCENVVTSLMVAAQLEQEKEPVMRELFLTTLCALQRAGEA
jgi:hypothetical protein|tara:strand:+ start:471 stop:662 length:192 start_codon:yes stop_codon:yes gene_type:complete